MTHALIAMSKYNETFAAQMLEQVRQCPSQISQAPVTPSQNTMSSGIQLPNARQKIVPLKFKD